MAQRRSLARQPQPLRPAPRGGLGLGRLQHRSALYRRRAVCVIAQLHCQFRRPVQRARRPRPSHVRPASPAVPANRGRARRSRAPPTARERLLVALDGVRFHRSDAVHCSQCSVRHIGNERRSQCFLTVVADGHGTVLPPMPAFVRPQQDAAATRTDMSEDERKQDCERNAAKRWIAAHDDWLQACRPVLPGDDLHCCQPVCETAAAARMDCIRVGKPGSRKRLYEVPESGRAARCARPAGCRGAGRASGPSGTVSAGRPRCPASGRPSQPATAGVRPAAGSALGGPATRAAPRPCPPSDPPAGRPRERNLSVNLFASSSETTFTHPLDGQI